MAQKRALITGITGQDGAYLAELLIKRGYEVFGTYRRLSAPNFWRLDYLGIFNDVSLIPCEITDMSSIIEALRIARPDEVYHLAAQSFVGASFESPISTTETTGISTTRLLEAGRQHHQSSRYYIAGSSEQFGDAGASSGKPLDFASPFRPMSPYAAAKLYSYWIARTYREGYGMFVANGVLFNHESPLRGLEFVSRKITNEVAKIKAGVSKTLRLGNLRARRDWGYAPEYVESMRLMLKQREPYDYVIASGESHSVLEFARAAFEAAGLDHARRIVVDRRFFRPLDVPNLIGDYSEATKRLGWKPRTSFKGLVRIMVERDIERWDRWTRGEKFPWDAPNYPSEARIITRTLRM